jgi:hypothetical protein
MAYPMAILLSGALGYAFPERPWRWAVVIIYSQLLVMILRGAGVGLLPLGVVLLGVLSVPAVAAASFGARMRQRRRA